MSRIKLLFIISLSALFVSVIHVDVQAQTDHSKPIGDLFQSLYSNNLFNGTVLVAEEGKVIYKNAFGYADYETGRELQANSPFYLASVSKQFTTMCIMILAERGKLNYDDKLSKYFPKFPAYADDVTIAQMMSHTSGVANHYRLGIYEPGLDNKKVLHTLINQKDLDFTPGEKYSYSNGAYVMLAMIVERVSGKSMADFMKENIFAPLGMNHSLVYDRMTGEISGRALGHDPFGGKDDYAIYTTGAGGLFSTAEDLLKWDKALYTEKLVKKASLDKAYMPTDLNDGSMSNYGFGWSIEDPSKGRRIVRHSGSLNGYRTQIFRDLDNKRLIVLLTNNTNLITSKIVETVDNILNDQSYEIPAKEDQYAIYVSNPNYLTQVLYSVISGEAGQKRDWDLFRYLFAPDARLIPVRVSSEGKAGVNYLTPDDYVERSGPWLEENGFHEIEISREVESFGHIRHVFSTYESYRSMDDEEPFARGINSIQLMNDGERWWIINIFWSSESDDKPIPDRYLPE